MSDLAEKFKELNDAVKPHNVGSAEHREAVRTLEIFVHANADEMIETLAEIARLRADVERKDEALKLAERTLAFIPDESIPKDMHAAVGLLKRKITAALADTANKQGEQTCDH